MATILIGLAVLVLVLWGVNGFTRADPKGLARATRLGRGFAALAGAASGAFTQANPTGFARSVRFAGGALALAGAAFLAALGQVFIAAGLAVTGAGLLGWIPWNPARLGWGSQNTRGKISRVRSTFVDMELEHDTGAMSGRIIAGRYAGAFLDSLEFSTLIALQSEFDQESRALLAAYLDRRDPRWREHAQAGAAAGQGAAPHSGKMTEQEAYQILGLEAGAGAEQISSAHRALMKKLHPDQGGSTYLAARVNEAKDVLTRRHR